MRYDGSDMRGRRVKRITAPALPPETNRQSADSGHPSGGGQAPNDEGRPAHSCSSAALSSGWSDIDGSRTGPAVGCHTHSALTLGSVTELGREERRRTATVGANEVRRERAGGTVLADVRATVQTISESAQPVFSVQQLAALLKASGRGWSLLSVRQVLQTEALAGDGCVVRVRHARYATRPADGALAPSEGVADHVLTAMRSLAVAGEDSPTRGKVHDELEATGMPYSSRAVRDGLLQLEHRLPKAVERLPGWRYRLVP